VHDKPTILYFQFARHMEEIFSLGLLVHFNFCETKFVWSHPFVVSFGWLASQWGYLFQGARANMKMHIEVFEPTRLKNKTTKL
jgi:hypothetical protein